MINWDYLIKRKTSIISGVLGIDEIKDEILVYVEYLKDPNKFDELGAKLPRGFYQLIYFF